MDPCIEVVEKLSQREKNSILAVLQRDDKIRVTQEQKIRRLKRDIHDIRMCSVLRAGDDQNKMCLRCRSELGFLFNRGALCPACKFKVCKACQEVMFNGSWLCQLCYKQRQLKWLTGEWAASFEQNPLRRWASGSDLIKPGLQLIPGAPTIDIDEPRSSQQNNNTDRKAIRNGVSRAEQEKTRVEVPKEGDQLKLTELFNVLRVKKPSEEVPLPETQVRKVTSRRYSESDSDSSSNSDVEVRSSSTGFSMTESEFDTRRIDSPIIEETVSPRRMESPLKLRDSPTDLESTHRFTSEHSERHESHQKFHLQFQNESHPQHTGSDTNYEIHRPVPALRSPKPSPRRLQVDQYDTSAHGQSAVRSKSPRTHEVKVEQEREAIVSKSVEPVCKSDTESLREEKVSENLSEHVVKTKESLDQKRQIEKSKSPSLEYIRINENQMVVRPKTRDRARKPDENMKQVRSDTNTPRAEHFRKRNEPKSDRDLQRPIPKAAANRKYTIPNDHSKPDETHSNNISENDMFISQSKHGETESESAQSLGQLAVPRTGSPYSISMDSIPSSHPSPTLQRISISESLPDSSDNDSVSKHSLQDINERTGAKEGDDYVEEEISKVRFRRMSKTLEKMAVISNMAKSPKTEIEGVEIEQKRTQSRGVKRGQEVAQGHEEGGVKGPGVGLQVSESEGFDLAHIGDGRISLDDESVSDETEVFEDIIKVDKAELKVASKASEDMLKKMQNLTAKNRAKSIEEMTWIDECDDDDVEKDGKTPLKKLPRHLTSSVIESERKPSEADSIEGMIDDMAQAQLNVETMVQDDKVSATESESGMSMTPISPFPEDLYFKRSGDYRLAYISDDNLDDDTNDVFEVQEKEKAPEKVEVDEKMSAEKKKLQKMGSLDLLLQEQGDFVDGSVNFVELEHEYQSALRYSEGDNEDIGEKENDKKETENKLANVIESSEIHTQNIIPEMLLTSSKATLMPMSAPLKEKPKLVSKTSLDVLLDKQGHFINLEMDKADFDAELLKSLERQFDENIQSQLHHGPKNLEYAYLGVAPSFDMTDSQHQVSPVNDDLDDFDNIVENAETLFKREETDKNGKEQGDNVNLIVQRLKIPVAETSSSDTSDSDILSVIEEVEDETSDYPDVENGKPVVKISSSNSLRRDNLTKKIVAKRDDPTTDTAQKNQEMKLEDEPPKKPPRLKGKLYEKVKTMESLVTESKGGSPAVIKKKEADTKTQDKYKKLHDHWIAIEKNEADILDLEDEENEINGGVKTAAKIQDIPDEVNEAILTLEKHIDEHDEELQVETVETVLHSTMNEYKDNLGVSINDSNALCMSISDISSPPPVDVSDGDMERNSMKNLAADAEEETESEKMESHGIRLRGFCHSLSDLEDEDTGDSKIISITDSNDICHSISDIDYYNKESLGNIDIDNEIDVDELLGRHKPVIKCCSISEGQADLVYHVPEDTEICHSIDEEVNIYKVESVPLNDELGTLIIGNASNMESKTDVNPHQPLKRLSGEKGKKVNQVEAIFKSHVDLQVDTSGHVSPPIVDDTLFFKVPVPPERPSRSKKTAPPAPKSPEIPADTPKENSDSPRSEKLAAYRVDSPQAMSETGSQDDSGHVSGGSRGTTPEHKRTDSNYSQSSIPSTLSTDDEDIDSLVAKVKQKQVLHGSRGNLLSVFGDSRESLASYYSDAGDIAYSNVPVTGEILLSINYNHKTGMLEVGIKNCRDIAVADSRRKKTDPYVKTYLLPDRTRNGKRKTKVKKHTTCPQFDETLQYQLTSSELSNRTLWVTVWHNDRFGRNTFLGEVTINFEYYKFDDPFPRWYPLQERIDSQPSSMMVYKGDLSISVRFVPKDKPSTSTGRSSKESGKGRLEVLIKEARNLTGVKYNGFSDPFCKGYLLPEKNRGSKQKTSVIRKECNPFWNHTFTFDDISLMELRERSLELTIWDHEKLSSNDFLGGARLNLGSGMSQGKPVDWMDARGEEMSIWQAMLDRPNLWIDGALILRPNMDKRKF
ncbi:uncharacterized protein LOC128237352 isoform X2 [Mya arenaria]|uniref:uncharacterized protein LOC128237352 isoform X2 n=1 Tax=Mya arenaria TaxID=6604 RepID=UPI0022E12C27|nr:uncharacterized protein LOC128237352 isoform X2 [Mya arenaria]